MVYGVRLGGKKQSKKNKMKHISYLVNWRSLASMLRCLMHILVRAEPMSLVAPGIKKQPDSCTETHRRAYTHMHMHRVQRVSLHIYHRRPFWFHRKGTKGCDEYLHFSY